jgi:L-ascorbate metabolism protein UlaG (beta-lactamase superfamily)
MDITYLGHSSFKIKGRSGSVVTDPFDPKMVGIKYAGVEGDIVTISHHHDDHDKSELVKNCGKVIDGPGEYEINGISIIGVPSYHDDKKGEERGKNTIYVFEVDDLRICHLGDLGHKLSDSQIEAIGDIDILMIPVGGVYTVSTSTAVEIVQEIEPSIIIPMHFKDQSTSEGLSKLSPVEPFLKEMGLTVEKLPKLSVKKEELVEETEKVVLLERK